jgi:2-oxoglutarate dehydrogenase complex dehydrogenase (E1) component-like enzyme
MSTGNSHDYAPAFSKPTFQDQYGYREQGCDGMYQLTYFATHAMQGLAANPECQNMSNEEIAATAVDMAKELSKALDSHYKKL